jgi:hypothetical protein
MAQAASLKAKFADSTNKKTPRHKSAEAPAEKTGEYHKPPSRRDKVLLSIYVDPALRDNLKRISVDCGTSTQAIGERGLAMAVAELGYDLLTGEPLPGAKR